MKKFYQNLYIDFYKLDGIFKIYVSLCSLLYLAKQKLANSNRLCNEIMLTASACAMYDLTY